MHKLYDRIQLKIKIPMLHIADATAMAVIAQGLHNIALLGTRFTMEEGFYKDRLIHNHGLEVVVPSSAEMESVHRIIYDELCAGKIIPASRQRYAEIINRLVDAGAEGIILGCTEIGLLVNSSDSPVPLFDTTEIHARAAVKFALAD